MLKMHKDMDINLSTENRWVIDAPPSNFTTFYLKYFIVALDNTHSFEVDVKTEEFGKFFEPIFLFSFESPLSLLIPKVLFRTQSHKILDNGPTVRIWKLDASGNM
jgi:hypothetical protein